MNPGLDEIFFKDQSSRLVFWLLEPGSQQQCHSRAARINGDIQVGWIASRGKRLVEFIQNSVQRRQNPGNEYLPAPPNKGQRLRVAAQAMRVRQRQQSISKRMPAFFYNEVCPIKIGKFIGWDRRKNKNNCHQGKGWQPAGDYIFQFRVWDIKSILRKMTQAGNTVNWSNFSAFPAIRSKLIDLSETPVPIHPQDGCLHLHCHCPGQHPAQQAPYHWRVRPKRY